MILHKVITPGLSKGAYNATLAKVGDRMWIAYRKDEDDWGLCGSIYMGPLDMRTLRVRREFRVIKGAEDPRFFWFNGQLYLAYIDSPPGRNSFVFAQMGYCKVNAVRKVSGKQIVKTGKRTEKNWTFFEYNGRLMAHYMVTPQIVFDVETREQWRSPGMGEWVWGWAHGGTSPIRIDDGYLCLFQSHLWMPKHRATPHFLRAINRVYFVGAMLFSAEPPFQILKYSKTPIEFGKWHIFPCGLVRDGEDLLITYGMNDAEIMFQKRKLKDVLDSMSPTVEEMVFIDAN